jgi:feruloyl-CoA synthase
MLNTVRNLREIAPTLYFNVPKGFESLVPHLHQDKALRERFFSRLQGIFRAGAGMADHVWEALEELGLQTRGEPVPLLTGFGATETAPAALWTPRGTVRGGAVGIPCPGIELKLVSIGDRLEARVRGPGVTPGYWRQPEATQKAFDDEGFYCLGDALRFAEPEHPGAGLRFDGRIAEEFKLNTGVWVAVGRLRAQLVRQFAPYIRDAVIAGENRGYLSAILIPNPDHFAQLYPQFATAAAEAAADARVRAHLREGLRQLQASATGSSTRIERLVVLTEPLSLDAGEVTDKGSVNQRALLRNRSEIVEALYAAQPPQRVIDARKA